MRTTPHQGACSCQTTFGVVATLLSGGGSPHACGHAAGRGDLSCMPRRRRQSVQPRRWDDLSRLPREFITEGIKPVTAGRDGHGIRQLQVWNPRQTVEQTRRAVLQHLASHLKAPGVTVPSAYHARHTVFLADGDASGCGECITLRAEPGTSILEREPALSHGRYTWVRLGTVAAREPVPHKRVGMDAHRLVCWLVHGPPDEAGTGADGVTVALHSCNNKRCVKPAHLAWGTASKNVEAGSDEKKRKQDARAGVLCLPLLPGTWADGSSQGGMVQQRAQAPRPLVKGLFAASEHACSVVASGMAPGALPD